MSHDRSFVAIALTFMLGVALATLALVGVGFYLDLTNTKKAETLEKMLAEAKQRETTIESELRSVSESKSEMETKLKSELQSEMQKRILAEKSKESESQPLRLRIDELEKANMALINQNTPYLAYPKLEYVDSFIKYDSKLLERLEALASKAKTELDAVGANSSLTELQRNQQSDAIRRSIDSTLRGVEVNLPFLVDQVTPVSKIGDVSLVRLALAPHKENKAVSGAEIQASVSNLLAQKLFRGTNVGIKGYIAESVEPKDFYNCIRIYLKSDGQALMQKFVVITQIECYAKSSKE